MSDLTVESLSGLIQPDRVHRRIYTDPAIFELEQTRVFGASWCYVAHESQLGAVGDYVTTTVGRRPIVITRGADGRVNGLLNRCTHRGALLVSGPRGCAKRFTCPYHGWTFNNDGRMLAMPFPANHPCENRSEFDLGRLFIGTYRGFVFATLHPDPEPLLSWLGPAREPFDRIIDRHPNGQLAVLPSPQVFEFQGNRKLSWDNAADGLHATFAHRSYNVLARGSDVSTVLARDPGTTTMLAQALGNGHMVVDQTPGIPAGPWSTMRTVPFVEPLEAALREAGATAGDLDLATGSMINLSLFPNLIFAGNQLLVVEPLAVDRTRLSMYLVLAPDAASEINLLRLRVDEDFVSFGTPDDLDMFERVQAGLAIPEMEWVDVSRGLDDGEDRPDANGVVTGPITSEAPQRGYLARYAELLTTEIVTRAR